MFVKDNSRWYVYIMFKAEQSILTDFKAKVKIAFEIEFYIDSKFEKRPDENGFLANILLGLTRLEIPTLSIDREVAECQYEVALAPDTIENSLQYLEHLKNIITRAADKYGKNPIFDAKPFENLPGSGLHVHISLHDELSDKNLLMRLGAEKEEESDCMIHSVGGLCFTMLKNFTAFAPNENSYKRYSSLINSIDSDNQAEIEAYNNAPVNVSWGGNNRTTAIRIPASSLDENTRHIEHRVAGVDADPELVVEKILEGIYIGLKDKISPPEKIYGNAYDEQYSFLEPFPKSLDSALSNSIKFLN